MADQQEVVSSRHWTFRYELVQDQGIIIKGPKLWYQL